VPVKVPLIQIGKHIQRFITETHISVFV